MVIGFDGMDYRLTQQWMRAGVLPAFSRLAKRGGFSALRSSMPPQSPVAWSDFSTGMNPGGHGIFDFIHRDPATMQPYLSMARVTPAKRRLRVGQWVLPLGSPRVEALRKGETFWEVLSRHDVPCMVLKMPANFPPVEAGGTVSLSGMGTPDLRGSYGEFSFFAEAEALPDGWEDVSGGHASEVTVRDDVVEAELTGPDNAFRRGEPPATVSIRACIDASRGGAEIAVGPERRVLMEGEWSDWVPVKFKLAAGTAPARGICRLHLKSARPFALYVSPVNLDPVDPAMPISTPADYSRELAEEIGPYYTQGMPEDTKALSGGVLTDAEFIEQSKLVYEERLRMMEHFLQRYREADTGFFFFYFSTSDLKQHMLWRITDRESPAWTEEAERLHGGALQYVYEQMDWALERVMEVLEPNTTLIVMSDHGFAPVHRHLHLNTWLLEEGYITLAGASATRNILADADWSATQAYGLGINGLYVNLRGRERDGVVEPGQEYGALVQELCDKLNRLVDPKTGERAVVEAIPRDAIYTGGEVERAPDILIGWRRGYRTSDESALGELTEELWEDNTGKWSGDHCMHWREVPGILLADRAIQLDEPNLTDLPVTILREFGIDKPASMVGRPVF